MSFFLVKYGSYKGLMPITMVTNKGKVCVSNKTKDYNIVKFYDTINEEKGKYDDVTTNADKIAKAIIKRHSECGIEWIR